ncbi:MAG TPA: VOC family protein [Tepidisphaeraceae bacterium]|jgi:catechol-2,3-dioxygenase
MNASDTHLKFACVLLPVRDLEMMTAFYRDVLGFPQLESDDPATVPFDIGIAKLCLHQAKAPMRDDDDTIGATMLFHVADVSTMREQLLEQGVRMAKLKSFGSRAECDGRDPEGNLFRLTNQG